MINKENTLKENGFMDKPKVGETLYSLNIGNAARNCEQVLTKHTVTKVGRKYFHTLPSNSTCEDKFTIVGWQHCNNGYPADCRLFRDPNVWYDEKEIKRIHLMFNDLFQHRPNWATISLAALQSLEKCYDRSKEPSFDEPRECPFCDSDDTEVVETDACCRVNFVYHCSCNTVGCHGNTELDGNGGYPSKEEAIAAYNKRAY